MGVLKVSGFRTLEVVCSEGKFSIGRRPVLVCLLQDPDSLTKSHPG